MGTTKGDCEEHAKKVNEQIWIIFETVFAKFRLVEKVLEEVGLRFAV